MDTFLQDEVKDQKKNAGPWSKMNWIQRGGVISGVLCFLPSMICDGETGVRIGQLGWSCLLVGYVAGNLWSYRHSLHYWWSLAFALAVHAALLPVFGDLVRDMKNAHGSAGKGYIYLAGGLVSVETIVLLYVLKHLAMWFHRRTHSSHPSGQELAP